jgi:murein DD-endopeptidase MepM/ murein hydrolase activator NlpD
MRIRSTCAGVSGGRFDGRGGDHEAIDLRADIGTDLHAITDGRVVSVGDAGNDGWGKFVIIESDIFDDGDPVVFVYAHLSQIGVTSGETITEGDQIGETGVSGNASDTGCVKGPAHVHIETKPVGGDEIYNTADPTDPELYLGTKFDQDGVPILDSCP